MKVMLLKSDGYMGMEKVPFPVEVEAFALRSGVCRISEDELARIGCNMGLFHGDNDPYWYFGPTSWEALA